MTAITQAPQQRGGAVLTKQLLRLKDTKQTDRIRVGNALDAVNRGASVVPPEDLEQMVEEHIRLLSEEAGYEDRIRERIEMHPLTAYLKNVKGASTINCAPLLAELDPHKAKHVSSFWAFVGYGMKDYWAKLKPQFSYKPDPDDPDVTNGSLPISWIDAAYQSGHEIWDPAELTEEILDDIMGYGDTFDRMLESKSVPKNYSRFVVSINELLEALYDRGSGVKPLDLRRAVSLKTWQQIGPILAAKYLAGRYKVVAPISGSKFKKVKGEKVKYTEVPEPEDDWFLVRSIDKQIKEWVSPYNKNLRVMCFRICAQFIRMGANSPYEQYYRRQRAMYETRGWPKGRVHLASVRKTMKLFLQHMWVTWRPIEGLPISKPYPIAKLGHTTYLKPEDFGWYAD